MDEQLNDFGKVILVFMESRGRLFSYIFVTYRNDVVFMLIFHLYKIAKKSIKY